MKMIREISQLFLFMLAAFSQTHTYLILKLQFLTGLSQVTEFMFLHTHTHMYICLYICSKVNTVRVSKCLFCRILLSKAVAFRHFVGKNMIVSCVRRYSRTSSELQIWGGEEELCDLQVGSSSGWWRKWDPQLHSGEEGQLKAGDRLELRHLHTKRMPLPGAQTHREEGVHLPGQGREQVRRWSTLRLQTTHRQESFRYGINYCSCLC